MKAEISLRALAVGSNLWLIPSTHILLSCRMVTTVPHLNLYIVWQKCPCRHGKGCQENLKFITNLHTDFMSSLMLSHHPQTSQNWNQLKNWMQGVVPRCMMTYFIVSFQNVSKEGQNYQTPLHMLRNWGMRMWSDLPKVSSYRKQSHMS